MLSHRTLTCCHEGCLAVITLHPDDEAKLRRTHEWFYCPAGHSQRFTGKTEEQKKIDELERQLANLREAFEGVANDRGDLTELAHTLKHALQTCPLGCGWSGNRRLSPWDAIQRFRNSDPSAIGRFLDRAGTDMVEHLVADHNATRQPVALLEAGEPEVVDGEVAE